MQICRRGGNGEVVLGGIVPGLAIDLGGDANGDVLNGAHVFFQSQGARWGVCLLWVVCVEGG